MPTYRFNVLCGFHTLFPVRFRSELEEPLVVQIHRTSDVFFPEVRFIEVNSHSIIALRGVRRANVIKLIGPRLAGHGLGAAHG